MVSLPHKLLILPNTARIALFALQYTLLTMLTLLSLLSLLTLLYEQKVGWMDVWIPLRLLEHLFSKKISFGRNDDTSVDIHGSPLCWSSPYISRFDAVLMQESI